MNEYRYVIKDAAGNSKEVLADISAEEAFEHLAQLQGSSIDIYRKVKTISDSEERDND